MKLSLAENIVGLRKERSLTQEQLAEALGVTFAAVSKWERGVATPELGMVAEIADFFEVSIDALIGYEFRNNDRQSTIERLKRYVHDRDNENVYADIEKSLRRYPNCFDVVYNCARIYMIRGLTQKNTEYAKRALSLYKRACLLISQNTDPAISEISLRNEIANVYLDLDEHKKALEILKKNNPCGLYNATIGYTLASSANDTEAALPYLSHALLDLTRTHMQTAMGYINVYCKTESYEDALAITDWALAFYPALKDGEKQSYITKCEATLLGIRAYVLLLLGRKIDAKESLLLARKRALEFDKAPSYDASAVRFVSCEKPATAYDDMGETALQGLINRIAEFQNTELSDLWEAVKNEA